MTLRVAIAQINATVGDLDGNVRRLIAAAKTARAEGADLLLTPELAISGYPPEDLLLRQDFYRACGAALEHLARASVGIDIVVGHPLIDGERRYNAATLLRDGAVTNIGYRKARLPNYEVFDEARYFVAGDTACVFELKGRRLGVNICADVWDPGAAEAAHAAGAEILLVLNASPYHVGKEAERLEVLRERIAATGMPIVYANLVGGQDELVFDGASMVLDASGNLRAQLRRFEEATEVFSIDGDVVSGPLYAPFDSPEAEIYQALVTGVCDYLGKNNFPGAIIGLSGGIDSALTLCVAVEALGASRVRAVMMPSPYTADISIDDSQALVKRLGVAYDEIPIGAAMKTYDEMLAPFFAGLAADTTEENVQARVRGNLLMALSNKTGSLVLTTGNKSEMAVGYCTLYGDMAGGFAVIKDIPKTMVYRLSRWINRNGEVIPDRIITRPPSAELRPGQTDQDSLPPYDVLDAIVEAYMERDESPRQIIAAGYGEADVRRVVRLLKISEYKRRQAPLGVRISQRGFGKDWRYPITNRYADEW